MFAPRCYQCGRNTALAVPVPGEEYRTEERPRYICLICYEKNGNSYTPKEETNYGKDNDI